jgi:hypothetical protein
LEGVPVAEITLRDVDNRDENGAPYEITVAHESVIGYLDGPLRRDLTEPDLHADLIDAAIEHVRAGRIREANGLLNNMSIYLSVPGASS